MPPKILLYDIENFPNIGYTWDKYETNVLAFTQQRMMCSVAYKWLGEREVRCLALPDYADYDSTRPENYKLVKDFYDVMKTADVTIAHNAYKFDERMVNTEFIKNGLPPLPPHKVVDTLRIARSRFKFNSNRLDDLGELLGVGRKLKHEGFGLWLKCMAGDMGAWKRMIRYNIQDVRLLERVYKAVRGWSNNHPNLNDLKKKDFGSCATCQSTHLHSRGERINKGGKVKERFQCQNCGDWGSKDKKGVMRKFK